MANFSALYSSVHFVEQILSGLPPKSLMRFQCVCNLWCNLIKSPTFIAKHLSSSMRASCTPILLKRPVLRDKDNNNKDEKEVDKYDDNVEASLSSVYVCNEDLDDYLLSTVIEDVNVPLPAPLKLKHCSDLTIAGHCDGIICLKLFIGNVILCNPAMKEFKLLPKSSLLLPSDDFDLWPLSYELRYYTEYLGFGYDPKGKGYKVVRFVIYNESCYWFRAEVHSMDSNSWREIQTRYDLMTSSVINRSSDLPIYFNGICYWTVSGYHTTACGEFILSFDMSNEVFHEILIPDLPDGCRIVTLAMWKECISFLTYQEKIGLTQSYDMWVLMDDHGDGKGSWTKHLTIRAVDGDKCPLLFWKRNQLLMVTNKDGRLVLCNIGTKMLKFLPIHFMGDMFYNQALVYVNSIVSINSGDVLKDIDISAFYGSGKFYSSHREVIDISAVYGNDKLKL